MECTYTIHQEGLITIIEVKGTLDHDAITAIVQKLWQGKDYKHPCELWDFRSCVVGVGVEELKQLSRFAFGNQGERGYGRIAFVVEKYLHVQLAKIFEDFAATLPFEIKTFRTPEPAKRWLTDKV